MVLGNSALARGGGENQSVEQLRQAQELGVGAGPMYSDSGEYGWTPGTCQHLCSGADHRRITRLPLQWERLDRVDVGAVVEYVLWDLNEYRSRPASLRLRARFGDARADFANFHVTRAKARCRLKHVELSAELMTETALLFDEVRFDGTGDQ